MNKNFLILGDILAVVIVTLIGFATHGETDLSFLPRFLALCVPLAVAWLLLAPWFSLFQPDITSDPKQLWRVPLAMIFAAPLVVTVRSAFLGTDVVPVFVLVFTVTSAFGVLVWRGLYGLLARNR
jgi:hypothetical protein